MSIQSGGVGIFAQTGDVTIGQKVALDIDMTDTTNKPNSIGICSGTGTVTLSQDSNVTISGNAQAAIGGKEIQLNSCKLDLPITATVSLGTNYNESGAEKGVTTVTGDTTLSGNLTSSVVKVEGGTCTLDGNVALGGNNTGVEITVANDAALATGENSTLTINGGTKVDVASGGTLKNEGTILNSGIFETAGTVNNTGVLVNNGDAQAAPDTNKISGKGVTVQVPQGGGQATVENGALKVPGGSEVKAGSNEVVTVPQGGGTLDTSSPGGGVTIKHTVTFDSLGGSAVASATVASGEKVTAPISDPTKTGHTFGGWYTDRSFGAPWDFDSAAVTQNVTLYAKWTPIPYSVTFDSQGGSAVAGATVNYGQTITQPANPTKAGSTFAGWYKDTAFTSPWNFDTDTVTGAVTLYAKWTSNSGGGGSGGGGGGSTGGSTGGSSTGSKTGETVTKTTTVTPSVSGNTAIATVSQTDLNNAFQAAVKGAQKAGGAANVEVRVNAPASVGEVKAQLPAATLKNMASSKTETTLTVSTPLADIHFDSDALDAIADRASTGTVTVAVSRVDRDSLTAEQQAAVGNSPVYDLSVTTEAGAVSSFQGGEATVTIPYDLPAGQQPEGIVVYLLGGDGTLSPVRATYENGKVTFVTGHFSQYVIAYDETRVWENPFRDVSSGDWCFEAVRFVNVNGLFHGTTDSTFSPNATMTRAMLVTVLHRHAGEPATSGPSGFSDVPDGQWFSQAVAWAAGNGIVAGTGAGFSPNGNVTREQLAAILYRYAGSPGASGSLSGFSDSGKVAAYAADAMAWAVGQGILTGKSGGILDPKGNATRAEVATMLMRFDKAVN